VFDVVCSACLRLSSLPESLPCTRPSEPSSDSAAACCESFVWEVDCWEGGRADFTNGCWAKTTTRVCAPEASRAAASRR